MDAIIPEDVSYLNFLNTKNQSLLLSNNQECVQIQNSTAVNDEPIFTEYVDGTTSITIGGVPVYLNNPTITEEPQITTTLEANDITNALQGDTSPEFPIEIPGKGFLTSSGLFFSNELLLELNLQQNDTEDMEPKTSLIQLSNDMKKPLKNNQNGLNTSNFMDNGNLKSIQILSNHVIKPIKLTTIKNHVQNVHLHGTQSNSTAKHKDLSAFFEIVSAHKCKNCFSLFESYDDIAKHINDKVCHVNQILTKDIFLCGVCDNVGFEDVDTLKEHMLINHKVSFMTSKEVIESVDPTKPGTAETAPITTNSKKTKKVNKTKFQNFAVQQEAQNKKVKCLLKGCDYRFSRVEVMMRHHDCHVNGNKTQFKCPECEKIFYAWKVCSAHLWKCHQIDIGLYSCPICNNIKTLSIHVLKTHMATHTDDFPFICATCGKRFKQHTQLLNHQYTHDKRRLLNAQINCPTCNTIFSCSKSLKKHIQAVHNKFKPFICNICGHTSARKHMLELHLRQHTGEKPYSCTLCIYKTGDHNSLRRHMSRHFGTTQYSCPHCDYQAVQSIAYKNHLKKNHPCESGFFSCLVCSFDTVNEERYRAHVEQHNSEASVPIDVLTINITNGNDQEGATKKLLSIVDDEETQTELFSSNHIEDMTVDTGGITIPAGSELQV